VDAPLASRPRALTWLQIAFAGALLGPSLLLAYVGWATHTEAIDAARERLTRLAQIAQEQSQRVVETNEVISRGITTRIGTRTNAELLQDRLELHSVLKAWTHDLQQLQSVWIWDDAGRPVATNLRPDPPANLDISDREYFIWARSPAATGWYVSTPLRSRMTGELFFDLSKRRSAADGSFQGAVSVSLRPAYFDAFFREQVASERGFTLSLVRQDGTLVSRYPAAPSGPVGKLGSSSALLAAMSRNTAVGEVQGVSTVDGVYRYVAYRRVGELPLYAVATASKDALLAPWRRSMTLLSAFTLPLAIGLAALCWFAMRRVRSEHRIALAHKEQYEQLLKAEDALRLAQKMEALGRLTGGVAHDFNNVLMVVQSSVGLARQLEARGQPVSRALAPIERAVANGAQLTRQLLAVVRRQPLQVRTMDIADVVPALAQLMSSTLGRGFQVTHEVEPNLYVTVDQAELELALINLCINAKDAMPDGGVIGIRARPAQPPADAPPSTPWARVEVSDTGEGIPSELLGRVTEPFFTTKPLGKGTGLGLSQVNAFVTQAGGRLHIRSEPGRGTEVAILLPCSIVKPEGRRDAQLSSAPTKLDAAVLLVEDNPDIADAVAAILQAAGARVTWHASADSASRALAEGARFDVVLSDVSVPGDKSGIDLARELASGPGIPIVLMTGYTDRLQEASAAGYRVVPKPAAPESLLQALIQARDAHARQ
jgi:two-component system, NtrC family, sensor kinase